MIKISLLVWLCLIQFTIANQWASVHRVIDGDSIVLIIEGKPTTCRLLGIDTPETYPNKHLTWQQHAWRQNPNALIQKGRKAKQWLTAKLPFNTPVRYETDEQTHDHYQRLLVYVFSETDEFINASLLTEQLAHIYIIPPNLKYQAELSRSWMSISDK